MAKRWSVDDVNLEEYKKKKWSVDDVDFSEYDFGVDDDYINKFLKDSQEYINSQSYNTNSYSGGIKSYDDFANSDKRNDLSTRANNIRAYLNANKNRVDSTSYKDVISYLDNYKKHEQNQLNSLAYARNYYSQWASEEDFNSYINNKNNSDKYSQMSLEDLKKEKEEYDKVKKDVKFSKYSKAFAPSGNPQGEAISGLILGLMDEKSKNKSDYDSHKKWEQAYKDKAVLFKDINGNAVTYESLIAEKENDKALEEIEGNPHTYSAYVNASKAKEKILELDKKYQELESQKAVYQTSGFIPDAIIAEQQSVSDAINQQKAIIEDFNSLGYDFDKLQYYNRMKEDREAEVKKAEEAKKYAEEHEIKATFKSMLSTPMMIGEYVKNLVDTAQYGYANVYDDKYTNQSQVYQSTVANIIDDAITNTTNSEFAGWLTSTAYSGVTSAAQSAMIGAVGTVLSGGNVAVGTGAALSIMGTQAAASSFNTSVKNGSTSGEAIAFSLASGIGEAVFEKLPLDNIFKLAKGAGKTATKEGIANLIKGIAKQSAIEGLEEGGTELWNAMADAIINGDHSAYNIAVDKYIKQGYSETDAKKMASTDWVKEVVSSMVGGFIGGGVTGGTVGVPSFAINQGIQNAQYDALGKSTIQNENVQGLVEDAQSLVTEGEKNALNKLANKVAGVENVDNLSKRQTKKYTRNVGKLVDEVANTKIKSIKSAQSEAIKHELEANGVKNVAEATDVVIKQMSGQTLTKAETKVFESVDGNTIIEKVENLDVKSMVDRDNLKRTEESLKRTGEMVFTKNKSVQHKQMVKDSGYTTTEGKTTVDATGVEVDSMIIDSLDGEDISLKVNMGEDSEIVLAGELTLNDNYAVMLEGLKRIGKKFNLNTSSANKLLALYEAYNGDAFTFYKAMEAGVSYGHYNIREYFDNNKFVADLPEAIKEKLYEIGRENAQKIADEKQALVELEGKAKAESKVSFAEDVKYNKLNKHQKAQVDFAQVIANTFGFDLEVFRSPKSASGRSLGENGSYSVSKNLMRLDIDAGTLDGKSLILFTQSHELTHYIQKWSPEKYKVFADFLMEKYAKSDVPVQKLIEQKIEESKISATMDKSGKHHVLTESEAFDEIVANACEDFLADPNIQQTILEIAEVDQSLAQKIKNFIKNLVARIEKALRGLQGQSAEAQFVRELDMDAIQELKALWMEALKDARENVIVARKNTSSKEKTTTGEGDVQMQIRSADDGSKFVEIDKDLFVGNEGKSIADAIRTYIKEEFNNLLSVNGQNIQINKTTNDEWRHGTSVQFLLGDEGNMSIETKAKTLSNADELLKAAKRWIGEKPKHSRKDNIVEFGRGHVSFRVDGAGYEADVLVAIKKNQSAVLYDLVDIKEKNITEASNTMASEEHFQRRYDTSVTENTLPQNTENVNTNDEKFQDRDVLQSSLRSLNNEYTQLKKEVEAIHQRPEYQKFLKDTSILEGEELDKVLNDYGEWSREVGLFAKTKRISEIENEQRSIEKKMRDDTALRREEFFKSIENMHEMEKMEYVDKAIERYGTTDRVSLDSYLMLNGEMLDFSEGQGYRVEDHRAISEILDMPYDYEYSDGLIAFMNMGNIRMQTYGIDISKLPNYEQKSTLRNVISQVMQENDEFTVDFSNDNGYTEGSVTYPRGTSSSKILSDIEDYFKTGVVPEYDSGISDFLYQDRNIDTTINESMTMEQAKLMIQKAFVLGGIYDWYDGEYKNGDDWIRNEGASEVALYIESEYSLMDKYFNDNQAYIDGDIYVGDVLEAYLAGTLVGKQAEKVTRLDVSKGYNVTDNRFYAPKKYNDIKTLWETANAKVTKANKTQVTEARKSFLFAAHNSDVAAELGISASEVNKKLRSWSNYSTKAKDISTRLNNGVAESNQWSGIQNCSILSQMSVTDEDITSMVKEIKGTSSEYQRNYIAKTMLALNTHIDWSELIFEFKRGSVDENRRSVRGLYENSKRTITIGGSSYQNTVAHEMGHALDYKWQRDLFGERAYNSALTNNSTRLDLIEGGEEAQQFYKNFRNFIKSLTDVNVNYSAYTMDASEVFARFVAKFVEWVNVTANSNTFRETDFYGDKFTASQYIEFVKLLQEKSKLDAKRMSEDVKFQDRAYQTSLDDLGLRKENEKLKADVENLKEMLKLQSTVTHGKVLAKAKYKDIAKKLLHDFGMKQVKDEKLLNGFVNRLDEYFSGIINSDELTWEFVMEGAYKVAKWVDFEMPTETKLKYDYAEEILSDIRSAHIVLDDLQKAEVAYYYGSYNAFRKSLFGSANLVNKGISLDSQWQEWSNNYPNIFDADISTNDMPIKLAEIIGDMKETAPVLNEEEQVQRIDWMAGQIYDAYWLMPTVKTLADKHQLQVNLLKGKHREQMDALRESHKAKELKTKEHFEEMLKKVKEHKDAQLEAYKEHVNEVKVNERERKNRTVMKNRIKGVVKELNSILSKGSKERNVKIPIQPAVMKALELAEYLFDDDLSNNFILTQANIEIREEEMADVEKYRYWNNIREEHMKNMLSLMDKEGTESQVANLKDTISGVERKMGYLEKKLSSLITNEKKKLQQDGVGKAVKALAEAYSQLKNSEEDYVKEAYNEGVYNYIDGLANRLEGAKVKEMSESQMFDVYTAFKAVLTTVRDANKLFVNGKREDVQKMSSAIMMEISGNKKSKTVPYEKLDALKSKMLQYSWNELKPYYAFQRLGSSTLMKLYEAARQGEDVLGRDYKEAIEFAERIKRKYGYDSWDMNKRYDIKLEDGRTFTLTLQEIMSIYAYSKREQAYDHMMFGGFVFNNKKFFKANEGAIKGLVKPKTYRSTDAEAYRLSVQDLTEISKIISKVKGLKGFVDEMQGYLSTDMAAKGNEISRVLYGVDWFNEKNYFPIKSSRDFLAIVNNPSENYSLRNSGMTKTTVPHAKNPLVLEDFMTVWAEHVGKMSTYHSLVIPIDNLNKVLGYKEASTSMKTVLDSVFGKSAKEYLDNFLKDLNGGVSSQGAKSPLGSMFGKFKKTAVAASTSVVVQQPTAILRAMAEIDGKYFVGASDKLKHNEKWELIKKYAPIAVIKELGGFDIGSGKKIETILTTKSYKGKGKVKGFLTDSQYRNEAADNAFMWGATKADEIGWNIIWSAVEREIKDTTNLKSGTEEFYKKVGERFTEVVHKTQVYDSTFTRSGYQRSKNDLVQMSMSFMGEPTTSFNMLYDAILQSSRKNISKGKKYRIIGATVSSIIFAAIAKSLIYALRDDDDDKSYLEKYVESTTENLVSDLIISNMLPFVKDITSIISGWEVERTDMAIFTDIYKSFKQLDSDTVSDYRKVEDLIGSLASLFGVPAKNLLRTGREMRNVVKNIFDNNLPYGQGVADAAYRGLPFTQDKSKTDKLYRATVNGTQEYLDKFEGEDINTSLKKGLRDNDKRILQGVDALLDSDYTKYGSIVNQIVAEGKFTKKVVSGAIQSEANYFGGKIEEGAEALRDGNDKGYKDVVKELRDRYRGIYTQDEIVKMIKNYEFEAEEESDEEESIYKTKYIADALEKGDTHAATEMIEDIVATKVANGKTEEEARKSVRSSLTRYWKPLFEQAFADGSVYEQNEIRESLYDMGVYGTYEEIDDTIHHWKQDYVLENYKPQYIQAYEAGDTYTMQRIENEIYDLGVYKNAYKTVRGWID